MGRHNAITYNDNTDTNMVMDLNTIETSAFYTHTETYTQLDHLIVVIIISLGILIIGIIIR